MFGDVSQFPIFHHIPPFPPFPPISSHFLPFPPRFPSLSPIFHDPAVTPLVRWRRAWRPGRLQQRCTLRSRSPAHAFFSSRGTMQNFDYVPQKSESVVDKARRERVEREKLRGQSAAALCIQKTWRRHRALLAAAEEQRAVFDATFRKFYPDEAAQKALRIGMRLHLHGRMFVYLCLCVCAHACAEAPSAAFEHVFVLTLHLTRLRGEY